MSIATDILFLRHQLNHFGTHSGYEIFIDQLNDQQISHDQVTRQRSINKYDWYKRFYLSRIYKKRPAQIGQFYNFFSYLAERDAIKSATLCNAKIIHTTFLEDNYGFLGYFKKNNPVKLVATAHMPVSWWKYIRKNMAPLKDLDFLITLTTREKNFFEDFLPGKVRLAHHGVDTDFFIPGKPFAERPLRILLVGNLFRDFIFFEKVISVILENNSDILIDMVCAPQNEMHYPVYKLSRFPQVTLHYQISDEKLLRLYQDSRILFLPLIDGTANNAILEAASCGLPVVTTDLEGTREYSSPSYAYYYKNKNDCLEYLLHAIRDDTGLEKKSLFARTFVLNNNTIPKVASEHAEIYRELMSGSRI